MGSYSTLSINMTFKKEAPQYFQHFYELKVK
jgi:hypothetical protein